MLNNFKKELNNPNTNFFMFATGKYDNQEHGDVDFERYTWSRKRYDKVKSGDLFVYRKIANSSENKKFYFYGIGKIKKIKDINENLVHGIISDGYLFNQRISGEDLRDFKWKNKVRKGSGYEQFFSNYGMELITKEDFIKLYNLGSGNEIFNNENNSNEEIKFHNQIEKQDYSVDDKFSKTKTRGSAQKVFSEKVKTIYNCRCCISGINTKSLLIGSHIIPWAIRKDVRLDPSNGLCLNSLFHTCFDEGLISISLEFKVLISKKLSSDTELYKLIKQFENKLIYLPKDKEFRPKQEYLKYHREEIFMK